MMRKMVLVPYDKYERLISGQLNQPKSDYSSATCSNKVADSPQIDQCHSSIEASTKDDILDSLPLSLRSKAKVILDHLRKHTSLQWNNKGEIIVDGKLITGSNIIDLIKVQLKDYKSFHPVGEEVFSQLVLESHVPLNLLTQDRRCQFGSGKIPPPPGKPVRRKRKAEVARHSWITL